MEKEEEVDIIKMMSQFKICVCWITKATIIFVVDIIYIHFVVCSYFGLSACACLLSDACESKAI